MSARQTSRQRTGQTGEALAATFLQSKGYQIIGRNWRCSAGEIDLIAVDGEILVFAEVKTRRTSVAGTADESVTASKGQRLLASAEWFISEHPAYGEMIWRIDLVAITQNPSGELERIAHIQNAILSS